MPSSPLRALIHRNPTHWRRTVYYNAPIPSNPCYERTSQRTNERTNGRPAPSQSLNVMTCRREGIAPRDDAKRATRKEKRKLPSQAVDGLGFGNDDTLGSIVVGIASLSLLGYFPYFNSYMVCFCSTFAEMKAPTGEWKVVIAWTLIMVSVSLWVYEFLVFFAMPEAPSSFTEESRALQYWRQEAINNQPISGNYKPKNADRYKPINMDEEDVESETRKRPSSGAPKMESKKTIQK